MLVKKLKLKNYMSYEDASVDFPTKGVILVTGENGSGKSSLYEAVGFAPHGKTVRGTKPWASKKGAVIVYANGKVITRSTVNGDVSKLSWKNEDADAKKYETATKAKDALLEELGSFDFWKKTHVFSITDVSNFTAATDGEKKRFLESILDLSKFDSGLKECRKDLSEKETELTSLKIKLNANKDALEKLEGLLIATSIAGLDGTYAEIESTNDQLLRKKNQIFSLESSVHGYASNLKTVTLSLQSVKLSIHSTKTRMLEEQAKQDKLLELDTCTICDQEVTDDVKECCTRAFISAKEKAEEKLVEFVNSLRNYESLRDIEQTNLDSKRELKAAIGHDLHALQINLAKQQTQLKQLKTIQKDIDSYVDTNKILSHQINILEREVGTLQRCESVLGLKGIRASLLGSLLTGIEGIANQYLGNLSTNKDIQLKLLPHKANKNGTVVDSIDIQVLGAGGGHGYDGASAGERRRIDVAILLALADVVVSQNDEGTLWFDEVLDSLDKKGCKAVVDVLQKFAETRNVVLISHSDNLVSELDVEAHFKIEDGKINKVK